MLRMMCTYRDRDVCTSCWWLPTQRVLCFSPWHVSSQLPALTGYVAIEVSHVTGFLTCDWLQVFTTFYIHQVILFTRLHFHASISVVLPCRDWLTPIMKKIFFNSIVAWINMVNFKLIELDDWNHEKSTIVSR